MKKLCLIIMFLACVSLARAESLSWVVGGKGDGTEAASTNAGVYDADTTTWAIMQAAKGAFLDSGNSLTVSNNGSGFIRITGSGADLGNAIVGVGAKCEFLAAPEENDDGIFIITAVNTGADTIDLNESFDGDGETVNVVVGGAFANPGDVPDSDDFSDGSVLGGGSKVWVRAIADYTTVDESDSILYVNTAGTASDPIIWEGHFAEISSEKGDFGIATFDANGKTNGVETAVGGATHHTFIGIVCENATGDGWNFGTDDNQQLIRCAGNANGGDGLNGDAHLHIMSCEFDNNTVLGIDANRAAIFGTVVSNNNGGGIDINVAATVANCLVFDNFDGATGKTQIRLQTNAFVRGTIFGCTVDGDNKAGSVGILQDSPVGAAWMATNNIATDCEVGIRDDSTLGQAFIGHNNLYNSNTTDAHANITPQPVDGDNFGNLVKNVAENVLWTADDQTYILQSAFKQAGTDAFYTRKYWDDFNGGAGDNPPDPLTGLSFMDMGGLQREEAGTGAGEGWW